MATEHPFIATLRDARIAAGLSQRDMAAKLGGSPSQFNSWDAGGHMPTLPNLERWAAVLGYVVKLERRDDH